MPAQSIICAKLRTKLIHMKLTFLLMPVVFSLFLISCHSQKKSEENNPDSIARDIPVEKYRPRFHFTPPKNWTNDPNGLVYNKGAYHLFYQYYPDSNVWGPMHWGHAISSDLVHWEHKPIALYPDSLGYIFSGSAVYDAKNTSGLGTKDNPPLVAIYTYHNHNLEKTGRNDFQYQALAFSLDGGNNWRKYEKNPVLKNPGTRDFRDPKVTWNESTNKWIMTLAVHDRVQFYSSPDLIRWTLESEFGRKAGAHGGVWECPDLFPLQVAETGREAWVLLVSINPGGPNGGSATQYFIGDFDGHRFSPFNTATKWIDYGTDDYAGVTWSGTGERKIFLGWMSNWLYANKVPTLTWRGAMTLPRELKIVEQNKDYYIASIPVKEFDSLRTSLYQTTPGNTKQPLMIGDGFLQDLQAFELEIGMKEPGDFKIIFSNDEKDSLVAGYLRGENKFFIDRSGSGITNFSKEFPGKHFAPRISTSADMSLRLIVDAASIELIADDGLTVMTDIFFPREPFNRIRIIPATNLSITNIQLYKIGSMYK
jgi:fructan beta-fructosidase